MTLREYLDLVVRPNLVDFQAHPSDLRLALNATTAVDTLAAHMFRWVLDNDPVAVAGLKGDDGLYRQRLASKSADFDLVFQAAKASKHVQLIRSKVPPPVQSIDQVATGTPRWDEDFAFDGEVRWDEQVFVRPVGAPARSLEYALVAALAFLEAEIASLGIP